MRRGKVRGIRLRNRGGVKGMDEFKATGVSGRQRRVSLKRESVDSLYVGTYYLKGTGYVE